jgi:translation initiation factor 3 subunit I
MSAQLQSSLPRVNTSFLPILLKGHERSITTVKYNQDGDLIFTAAKDNTPTVWYAETGERLGTYSHHRGAVLDIDPSWDSKHVLTACADGSARLFEATTGKYIARMPHNGAVRACAWGESSRQYATASDPFHSRDLGCLNIFDMPTEDVMEQAPNPTQDPAPLHLPKHEIHVDDNDKAVCLGWTIADQHIIAGFDSGIIVKYDAEYAKEVARNTKAHRDRVNRLTFNRDKTLLVSASRDCFAKMIDPNNLEIIKEYRTARPVNGAVISPTHPHVLVGGGQDAQSVTTTGASSGKFETRFFHMIYGEEFGRVKGHFGPINALAVHPYGKSFASGSEDGFIRLHRFESSYLSTPDLIPHDLKTQTNSVF